MENEQNKLPESWSTLFEVKRMIQKLGGNATIKELLFDRVSKEELETLYNEFTEYFKNFPINHPLRMEASKLLIDLGFIIIDNDTEEKTYLDKSIVDEIYKNIEENPVTLSINN